MISQDNIKAAIYASIVGDALGVPVESSTRQQLALSSVKNMLGYGRYDQPEGTWSDDSSMILCTMECLCDGYDIDRLAKSFCSWLFEASWTPAGYVFDAGLTTFIALESIWSDKKSPLESGQSGEDDNGNGSLMRILPAALYFALDPTETLCSKIHEISSITHAHPRTAVGCGIVSLVVRALCEGLEKNDAYKKGVADAIAYYEPREPYKGELKHYMRVLSLRIPTLSIEEIESSGYVVHTLEAALWCFLRGENTRQILLDAVNLGLDTDTTGTVAGGLAGLAYGLESIPDAWMQKLVRRQDIDVIVDRFSAIIAQRFSDGRLS